MGMSTVGANGKARTITLAVTGGVGSGKSVVCTRLKDHGIPVFSADELARDAVSPGTSAYEKIVSRFGTGILLSNGALDRAKLRQIITEDRKAKADLEGFVHPEVIRQMLLHIENVRQKGAPVVAVEVPLLFESGLAHYFDYVLTVTVDQERRIERLMLRDRVSRQAAEDLMRIQMPEAQKLEQTDFVIDNNGSQKEVSAAVDRFYNELMREIKKKDEND